MKTIPVLEVADPVALCQARREEALALLEMTCRTYGSVGEGLSRMLLPLADKLSRRWLDRCDNPYRDAIERCASVVGTAGVYALNLSCEWGCTTGVFAKAGHPEMLRVLDWPFLGLGTLLCVAWESGTAGRFAYVTWPGIVGVFQGMAPGRFSVALNQAPLRRQGLGLGVDWLWSRTRMHRRTGLPPAHLLRMVFEGAHTYTEALEMLVRTPLCIPVIYTLVGLEEACVIERVETDARVRTWPGGSATGGSVAAANHFVEYPGAWRARPVDSTGRAAQMGQLCYPGFEAEDFSWLDYPMINHMTRLLMLADARRGRLLVQGREATNPALLGFGGDLRGNIAATQVCTIEGG